MTYSIEYFENDKWSQPQDYKGPGTADEIRKFVEEEMEGRPLATTARILNSHSGAEVWSVKRVCTYLWDKHALMEPSSP